MADEIDYILEGEHENVEVDARICSMPQTQMLIAEFERIVLDAFNKGLRMVVDIETMLYESAISLLALMAGCSAQYVGTKLMTAEISPGETLNIFIKFKEYIGAERPGIYVVINNYERDDDFSPSDLQTIYTSRRTILFGVFRSRPPLDLAAVAYDSNTVQKIVRRVLEALGKYNPSFRERIKYIGRVPYENLLYSPLPHIEKIAREWMPPPPFPGDYLREEAMSIDELVLPEAVKKRIVMATESFAARDGVGSLLLIGLPGSGRKTIARAIARELGAPAYYISISNILSRFQGESEARLNKFFETLRARRGLAVFDSVDSLFRRSGNEDTSANLRNILFNQLAREDNNFIIVFTADADVKEEVLDSPLLGEQKLVIPPPNNELRRTLCRRFFDKIASRKPAAVKKISDLLGYEYEKLRNMFANPFIDVTLGLTPGEIYRAMNAVLLPFLYKAEKKARTKEELKTLLQELGERIASIGERDYTPRQSKIYVMKEKAVRLGIIDIARELTVLEEELGRKAIEVKQNIEKLLR